MTLISISEAAKRVDLSIDTIRRWDKSGIIRATRDAKGKRHFHLEEIERVLAKRETRYANRKISNYKILFDPNKNGYSCIDLFAGCGGTALGLENAGFSHLLLSEIDNDAVATLTSNRPEWNVRQADVSDVSFREYLGKVDLIEGGFPCQAFSYAGTSKGFADTRGTLFFQFARAIQESIPKVFIAENVKGLLRHDKGRTLSTMIETLASIEGQKGEKYTVALRVVKSQYHDVPQKRERLIIIGVRSDLGEKIYFPKERDYIVSLWEAIGDRPQSKGQKYPPHKEMILAQVPEGGYWRDLPSDVQRDYLGGSYQLSGGKTGMARRLAWDEPSLTLTCSPAQKQTERCHPEETRPLNLREYARIQTFPDDWHFAGNLTSAYRQIGNAVPVNLGYYLGKCAEATLRQSSTQELYDYCELAKSDEYLIGI